ncbi:MAG: hypothetical protein ACYDGM_08520 [Vulcanimicrobiaceae bacterium]
MNTYTEFAQKVQAEFLNSLKAAQELNVKSFAAFNELLAQAPTGKVDAAVTELPTPTEIVEHTFAFTNQLIETRKEYAVKLAELATEAQKQFAQTASRIAESAKN